MKQRLIFILVCVLCFQGQLLKILLYFTAAGAIYSRHKKSPYTSLQCSYFDLHHSDILEKHVMLELVLGGECNTSNYNPSQHST